MLTISYENFVWEKQIKYDLIHLKMWHFLNMIKHNHVKTYQIYTLNLKCS